MKEISQLFHRGTRKHGLIFRISSWDLLPESPDPKIQSDRVRLQQLFESFLKGTLEKPKNMPLEKLTDPEGCFDGWLPPGERLRKREVKAGTKIVWLSQYRHPDPDSASEQEIRRVEGGAVWIWIQKELESTA